MVPGRRIRSQKVNNGQIQNIAVSDYFKTCFPLSNIASNNNTECQRPVRARQITRAVTASQTLTSSHKCFFYQLGDNRNDSNPGRDFSLENVTRGYLKSRHKRQSCTGRNFSVRFG